MKKSLVIFLHIAYWFLYLLICLLIFGGMMASVHKGAFSIGDIFHNFLFIMAIPPSILSFYGFYFLVFRFLKFPIPIIHLCLWSIAVILGSSLIGYGILLFVVPNFKQSPIEGHIAILLIMSVLGLIHGVLASVIRGFIAWYENLKITQEQSEKNFAMEMALIKSKLDPNFLFNSINNIDILINKDPEKASNFLNKLSDIMRFMLYETKTESILLQKEWEYLEKYIALQKIRSFNPNFVQYAITGNLENVMISPMILIPFVENAFKYGEKLKTDKAIEIRLAVENGKINFLCRNKFLPNFDVKDEFSGLGNDLINRRLALIYPEQHHLEINNNGEVYEVKLEIKYS